MAERPPPQRVEVVVPVRTLLVLLGFAALVALALLSLGSLLSIFLAAVLALGLDPVVGALLCRGWRRGPAALVVFASLFAVVVLLVLVTAGPVWEQIVDFVNELPEYWDELTQSAVFQDFVSTADADDTIRNALKDLAAGLPEAATALLGVAGGVFGSVLSLVTLSFLALFVLMERPTITDWLFGFTPPAVERRWRPVVEDSISAVSSSLLGNVAISVVAGTVAGLSAWALGLPFPLALALITGLLDLIPQVGATIAAVILVDVERFASALGVSAVVGLLNAFAWPAVIGFVLPLTVLTLGLAVLLLNGAVVLVAAEIAPGVEIDGLAAAVGVTLILTAAATLASAVLSLDDDARLYRHRARRLARAAAADVDTTTSGVLFLEIDGLAHDVLRRAMRDGNAPSLARWLRDGTHRLVRWETDWSSQTGACQAGLLHGCNEDLPAFRWWETENGGAIVTNHPRDAAEIERRVSDGSGLLHADGASRANILSGDAPSSLLTMSTVRDVRRARIGNDYFAYFSSPYPEVTVMASGCLGLISLPRLPGRVTRERIEALYPRLLPALVEHPGIGFALVRTEARGAVVLGAHGARWLDEDRIEGDDPLAPFGEHAARHVARTDRFAHCPDIVVNSTYWPDTDEVAAFEELVGSHGGMGGPQSFPFVLAPAELDLPGEPIVGAEALHRVFRGWLAGLGHAFYGPG